MHIQVLFNRSFSLTLHKKKNPKWTKFFNVKLVTVKRKIQRRLQYKGIRIDCK